MATVASSKPDPWGPWTSYVGTDHVTYERRKNVGTGEVQVRVAATKVAVVAKYPLHSKDGH